MADKTKFSVNVIFDKKILLTHVGSSQLQKEKGGQKTRKTLGSTKPKASFEPPLLHWEEATDPIQKTVTMSIKEVTITVTFSARIWIDKRITKSSDCYVHVMEHEMRHVKIWAAGARKRERDILKAVTDATEPTMDNPVVVKQSQAKKVRDDAFNRIAAALDAAVQKAGAEISKDSKKIHTPAELKKTNSLCELYLTG